MTGLLHGAKRVPQIVIECSSISLEGSAELRKMLAKRGVRYLSAPVSGNAKVIKAGRLSFTCSGPKNAFVEELPYLWLTGPSSSNVAGCWLTRYGKSCY